MRIDCLIPCARREFVQLRVLLLGAVASLAFAAVWLLVALLAHFSLIEGVAAQGNAVLVYVLMIGLFSLLGIFSWRNICAGGACSSAACVRRSSSVMPRSRKNVKRTGMPFERVCAGASGTPAIM